MGQTMGRRCCCGVESEGCGGQPVLIGHGDARRNPSRAGNLTLVTRGVTIGR